MLGSYKAVRKQSCTHHTKLYRNVEGAHDQIIQSCTYHTNKPTFQTHPLTPIIQTQTGCFKAAHIIQIKATQLCSAALMIQGYMEL